MSNLISSGNDFNSSNTRQIFDTSITSALSGANLELVELTFDAFIDSDIVKNIPIVSYVKAGVDVFQEVKRRNDLKKLYSFLQQLNAHKYDEKFKIMKEKLLQDEMYFKINTELALEILERMIDAKKAKLLAEIFYLRITEEITQEQYTELVYIIDQIHCADINILILIKDGDSKEAKSEHISAINRLVANGIVYQKTLNEISTFYKDYKITRTGEILCQIAN